MPAPTANQLYSSLMQTAGDLVQAIGSQQMSNVPVGERAQANRANAQAALALIQSAVTIHAASKSAGNGRKR